MSVVFLKVKVKSLAAEVRIIRREERRNPELRGDLARHRRDVVRKEARHSLLAYGYLRGRKLSAMEPKAHTEPNWSEVERMIRRYGPPAHNTSFEDWRKNEQTKSICRPAA